MISIVVRRAAAKHCCRRGQVIRTISNFGHNLHDDMLDESKVEITDVAEHGFIVNEQYIDGSIYALEKTVLHWQPRSFDDITADSLCLTGIMTPPIELLIIGCGSRIRHDFNPEIRDVLRRQGVVLELLNSVDACATFNILNAEDRRIAAAIVSVEPAPVKAVPPNGGMGLPQRQGRRS